jgi:hypothetical protein
VLESLLQIISGTDNGIAEIAEVRRGKS